MPDVLSRGNPFGSAYRDRQMQACRRVFGGRRAWSKSQRRRVRLFPSVVLAALLLLGSQAAGAQGCSQCRDNVAQSNPEVRRGYREAILLMLAASVSLFGVSLVVLRKHR